MTLVAVEHSPLADMLLVTMERGDNGVVIKVADADGGADASATTGVVACAASAVEEEVSKISADEDASAEVSSPPLVGSSGLGRESPFAGTNAGATSAAALVSSPLVLASFLAS